MANKDDKHPMRQFVESLHKNGLPAGKWWLVSPVGHNKPRFSLTGGTYGGGYPSKEVADMEAKERSVHIQAEPSIPKNVRVGWAKLAGSDWHMPAVVSSSDLDDYDGFEDFHEYWARKKSGKAKVVKTIGRDLRPSPRGAHPGYELDLAGVRGGDYIEVLADSLLKMGKAVMVDPMHDGSDCCAIWAADSQAVLDKAMRMWGAKANHDRSEEALDEVDEVYDQIGDLPGLGMFASDHRHLDVGDFTIKQLKKIGLQA